MYEEHPIFEDISDDSKLWRYMDFAKFLEMLESNSLFFTRVDNFEDKFEGSNSKFNKKVGREVYSDLTDEQYKSHSAQFGDTLKMLIRNTCINCWHSNEYESEAMWKLYSHSNESVAIQATYSKFKSCFNKTDTRIYIGKVNYIDYEKDWLPESNLYSPFLHKRKSFEHEREVRALIQEIPDGIYSKDKFEYGKNINIDLNCLIEKIYISPIAPRWFFDLVKKILIRYGFDKEVVYSNLNDTPIY
jgi:hypothetical protein